MEIHFPIELQCQVEQAIIQGEWATGQSINPTSLSAHFQVAVEDTQAVLRAEYRKGLLAQDAADKFRVLGLVAPKMESVFQHTSKIGFKPSSIMRGVVIEPASKEIAQRLDVPFSAPVYRLDRTRLVNGEVLANQINVIPFEVCPGLENDDVSHASFQQLIDGKYHAVTSQMKEEFTLGTATVQDQQILGLGPGAPILVIQRLASSATSRPLIWTEIHVRPDRFDYVAALWPSAKELLREIVQRNPGD